MNNKNKNGSSNNATVIVIAVIVILIGIMLFNGIILTIGIVTLVLGIKNRKNSNKDNYSRVRSGQVSSMQRYNTAYDSPSASSYPYMASSSNYRSASNVHTSNVRYDECSLDKCNPNSCPICCKISSNGYCIDCGYKFRH